MLVIAHRGACLEAVENSFAAFDLAVDAGAERIELDVQVSMDNRLVIMHDDMMARTTDSSLVISRATEMEIRSVRLTNGEPVPFLDDVLQRYLPIIELNIEIKPASELAAKLLLEALQPVRQYWSKIVVSSFKFQPMINLAQAAPELNLACLWSGEVDWPYLMTSSPISFMQSTRAKIFHPWVKLVNQDLMDQAKHRGWLVYPYCDLVGERVNPHALWQRLSNLGIDGLCTNYPREFRSWLNEQT